MTGNQPDGVGVQLLGADGALEAALVEPSSTCDTICLKRQAKRSFSPQIGRSQSEM